MDEMIDDVKTRLKFLDELLEERNRQLDLLRSSTKSVEGYVIGIKELASANDNLFLQQKRGVMDLLSQQKLPHESFQVVDSILTNFYLTNKNAAFEAEKVLLGRQCEVMLFSQEVDRLSQTKVNLTRKLEELQIKATLEKRKESGVRPDQDPNTHAGRAAIDLQIRKKRKKLP